MTPLLSYERGEADSEGAWTGARPSAGAAQRPQDQAESEGKRPNALAASKRDNLGLRKRGEIFLMNELYLMVTIAVRSSARQFVELFTRHGVAVTLSTLGAGTARSELLDYFGLEKTEKVVTFSVVTRSTWRSVKSAMQRELSIDVPGTGIAFIIPMSSIGGKKPLAFLTDGQDFEAGEESALKGTKYELLVVIANQGYTELIMDAAREQQAGGGTVLHAKGTGMEKAEKFLGFSLVNEKEMVFIVVKTATKNRIMRSIMDKAGIGTKAQSIVFSLPVTGTAGMRLLELAGDDTDETDE